MAKSTNEYAARAAYAEVLPTLREFRVLLETELNRVMEPLSVYSRVKGWDAISANWRARGDFNLADFPDLVGMRVVVPTAETLFSASRTITEAFETLHLRQDESATVIYLRSWPGVFGGVAAKVPILTAAENARRILEHEIQYKVVREGAQAGPSEKNATERLSSLIGQFEALISIPEVREKIQVHIFIRQHSFILYQNPDQIIS